MNTNIKIVLGVLAGYLFSLILTPTTLATKTKSGLTTGCNAVFQNYICNTVRLTPSQSQLPAVMASAKQSPVKVIPQAMEESKRVAIMDKFKASKPSRLSVESQ